MGERSTPAKAVKSVNEQDAPSSPRTSRRTPARTVPGRRPSDPHGRLPKGSFCRLFGDDCIVVGEAATRDSWETAAASVSIAGPPLNKRWAVSPRVLSSESAPRRVRCPAAGSTAARRAGSVPAWAAAGSILGPGRCSLTFRARERSRFARGAANIKRSDGSSSRLRLTRARGPPSLLVSSCISAYRYGALLYPSSQHRDKRGLMRPAARRR